uniref:Uncharacterized protein n=1 Tax=Mycena chlorophos TaxID=658473 RepID=A0ABQ0KZF1_MYCCL|nr:predicted protein [Mycena chlorophos]
MTLLNDFLIKFPRRLRMAKDWTTRDNGNIITRTFVNGKTREAARIFVSGIIVGEESNHWGDFIHIRWEPGAEGLYTSFTEGILQLKQAIEETAPESWQKTTETAYCTPMASEEEDAFLRIRRTALTTLGCLEYDSAAGFLPAHENAPTIALGAAVRCVVTFIREERLAVEYEDDSSGWAMAWLLDAAQINRCYVRTPMRKRPTRLNMCIESSDEGDEDETDDDEDRQSEVFGRLLQRAREEAGMEDDPASMECDSQRKRKREPSVEV